MANERARQLRVGQTDAERELWRRLRVLKTDGFHFRRQVPIDHLIVDFACLSARLVIEVDGGQHNWEAGRHADEARDAHLHRHGFTVLRFWNNEVMGNPEGVMESPPPPPLPARGRGLVRRGLVLPFSHDWIGRNYTSPKLRIGVLGVLILICAAGHRPQGALEASKRRSFGLSAGDLSSAAVKRL